MGRLLWLVCVLGACYSPTVADGLPCTDKGQCPAGQTCDTDTNTCYVTPPPGAALQDVSAGKRHTCGLDNASNLLCWGDNSAGQLGVGDADPRDKPTIVPFDRTWFMVSAGEDATCGIDDAGDLYCWGAAAVVGTASNVPRSIPDPAKWLWVSVGHDGFCAVASDSTTWCSWQGSPLAMKDNTKHATRVSASHQRECILDEVAKKAYCWGANDRGQALKDAGSPLLVPTEIPGSFVAIAAGVQHTCGIDDAGHLSCWGDCEYYQTGSAPTGIPYCAPTQVGTDTYLSVAAGDTFTCAINQGHHVVCFGMNDAGQLGHPTISPIAPPEALPGNADFVSITAGDHHACATTSDKHGYCWGSDGYRQLGIEEVAFVQSPQKIVAGPAAWLQVSTGLTTTCGIATDHSLWCWGSNGAGQLADGSTTRSLEPIRIGVDEVDWYDVSVGSSHICALKGDPATASTAWCWGDNQRGQLGRNPADVFEHAPRQVGDANDWLEIEAGTLLTCGVRSNVNGEGGPYCWGNGNEIPAAQQNASTGYQKLAADANALPVAQDMYVIVNSALYTVPSNPPTPDTHFQQGFIPFQVARGKEHSCGIHGVTSGSTLSCWGTNTNGQLGVPNSTTQDPSVQEQKNYTDWSQVDVGGVATCAIRQGGALYCWGGARTVGSLIPTANTSAPTPITGTWSSISVGSDYACAIRDDQSLWCWGDNSLGELGGGAAGTDRPMRVHAPMP